MALGRPGDDVRQRAAHHHRLRRRPVRPARDADSDEAATLVGVALIQVWWAISFMAGARGNGSGVASAGILGAGWAALTNGFPIVYCPPVCEEARPLTDLGHVGSIVFGILLALVAIWSLWRARVRPGWFMPAVAAALVVGTVVSLANTPIT
jgi:hypothetical protein